MNVIITNRVGPSRIFSLILLALGLLLIFQSEATIITISYIIGGILIAVGALGFIRFFGSKEKTSFKELHIVYGVISVVLGIIVIFNPKAVASIIPIVIGIGIIISGGSKLQLAFELKAGKYEVAISDLTLLEIRQSPQSKQISMLNYLGEIEYRVLHECDEIHALADEYVKNGVLTRKNRGDCLHIAFATLSECDVIVSWNFKHMVRLKTIRGVRAVNMINGFFKPIEIMYPTMIGDDTDESTGDESEFYH